MESWPYAPLRNGRNGPDCRDSPLVTARHTRVPPVAEGRGRPATLRRVGRVDQRGARLVRQAEQLKGGVERRASADGSEGGREGGNRRKRLTPRASCAGFRGAVGEQTVPRRVAQWNKWAWFRASLVPPLATRVSCFMTIFSPLGPRQDGVAEHQTQMPVTRSQVTSGRERGRGAW